MATPPAGSSLLFGALADSGRIKERKNGSYRMVLKGVDDIDWFTDRPDRVAGEWSPKKLLKEWDVLFSDGAGAPNAQATFEMGGKRELVTFEMFKPKLSDSNQTLSFKVRGIGEKNKDLLTSLRNKRLSDASLFIDDGTTGDRTVTLKIVAHGPGNPGTLISLSSNTVFGEPFDSSGDASPELDEGKIYFTGGYESSQGTYVEPGILSVPVTLKNGITSSQIGFKTEPLGACFGEVDRYFFDIDYSVPGGGSGSTRTSCSGGFPDNGTVVDIYWG